MQPDIPDPPKAPAATRRPSRETPSVEPPSMQPAAARGGLAAFLRRYLVSDHYWETATGGTFHLVAILMAFIIGTAWGNRDTTLKDLRSQQVVLTVLAQEIGTLRAHVDALKRMPPSTCEDGFTGTKWNTPVWDDVSKSEKYLLIDEKFYPRIRDIYTRVATARQYSSVTPDCAGHVDALAKDLQKFLDDPRDGMQAHINAAKAGRANLLWSSLWQIVLLTVAGLVVVWSLPPAARAAEFLLRRRALEREARDAVAASESKADPGAAP